MIPGDRHVVLAHLQDLDVCLVGLHLDVYDESGATRLKQLQQLQRLLDEMKPQPGVCILAGDFNAVRSRDYTEQQLAKMREHDKARDVLTELRTLEFVENSMKFRDCFDLCQVRPPVCSTWSGRRIDFVYLKAQDKARVTSAFYWPSTSSDHIPVGCDFEICH